MKKHLSDYAIDLETTMNPPPIQEMNSTENKETSSSQAHENGEHTNLEMVPL